MNIAMKPNMTPSSWERGGPGWKGILGVWRLVLDESTPNGVLGLDMIGIRDAVTKVKNGTRFAQYAMESCCVKR